MSLENRSPSLNQPAHFFRPGRLGRRIFFWFMILSLIPLSIISVISYQNGKESLFHESRETLNAVAGIKARYISSYFLERLTDLGLLSQQRYHAETLDQFRTAFKSGKKNLDAFIKSFRAVLLTEARTADLKAFQMAYGYSDLLLIDDAGNVFYSAMDGAEKGTNLFTGVHSDTLLAKAARKALETGRPVFSDLEYYAPQKAITGFLLRVMTDEYGDKIGLVALGLSTERIATIMQSRSGLGDTGESYLVGKDLIMRSNSRFSTEPTILKKKVDTEGTRNWLTGLEKPATAVEGDVADNEEKTVEKEKKRAWVYTDYRGEPVVGLQYTLEIAGVHWAVVVEIDLAELTAPLKKLSVIMWITVLITAGLVMVVGMGLARSIARPLNEIITTLASSSTQIAVTVDQQEKIASMQASTINETSTTMEELGASARQSSERADTAAQDTRNAMDLTQQGLERVDATLRSMKDAKERVEAIARQILLLSEQTGQIRQITDLVSDFANETKMLAMNAAVEAVRAGEHGKGFSVLAVETRKLADESKRSADRINDLVAEIQKVTNATVMATEEGSKTVDSGMDITRQTTRTFQDVTEAVQAASEGAQQISMNVRQQSVAVKQVVEAMKSINTGARESSLGITQVKSGIDRLNDAARSLQRLV